LEGNYSLKEMRTVDTRKPVNLLETFVGRKLLSERDENSWQRAELFRCLVLVGRKLLSERDENHGC